MTPLEGTTVPGWNRKLHAPADLPVGEVDRIGHGVAEADIFLTLIVRAGIELDTDDRQQRVVGLSQRNAGIVG
jgi:hypothetical protein